jgi:hypothetical protein
LLRPFEISFSDTGVLFFSCTGRMIPHPCAFTTTVWYFPEKLCSRSRLVIITGICRETLVLRRTFLNPSRAIPSLGLNVDEASQGHIRNAAEKIALRRALLRKRNK